MNTPQRIRKTVLVVTVFASLMAFFGILQWLANPQGIYGWRPTPQSIPFASYVNQHHFAALMEMTIGLPLALLVGKATHRDKRLLLVIAVVLMGVAVILTSSRGGLLSLIGVLTFVYTATLLRRSDHHAHSETSNRSRFARNITMAGGGLALVLLFFGTVLLLGGDTSLLRGIGITSQVDFTGGRAHFWSVALSVFRDYPLLGTGLDSFATVFPRYDTWNGFFRVEQVHNDYLQILTDAGIAGFVCAAAFIYLLFRQGFRVIATEHDHFRRSVALGALAGCFGILVHSFFDFPLRTPANAFFFLLFAVLATAEVHFPRHQRHRNH